MANVHSVEVGDEFHFRIELSIIIRHHLYLGGINISKVNGIPIATSVIASRGYPNEFAKLR